MTARRERTFWILLPLAFGIVAPIIAIVCIDPHLHAFTTPRGLFLTFVIMIPGLLPFAALSAAYILAARRLALGRLRCVIVSGVVGILIVFIPGYIEIFTSTSSTAILGVFVLAFDCFVSLVIGLLVGWGISRVLPFEHQPKA